MKNQLQVSINLDYRKEPLFRCVILLEHGVVSFAQKELERRLNFTARPEAAERMKAAAYSIREATIGLLLASIPSQDVQPALHRLHSLLENLSIDLELFPVYSSGESLELHQKLDEFRKTVQKILKEEADPSVPYHVYLQEICLRLDQCLKDGEVNLQISAFLLIIDQARELLQQQLDHHLEEMASTTSFESRMTKLRKIQREAARKNAEPEPPICPACGRPMVLRTAKSGPSIGEKFWGCSGYPICKAIIEIENKK